MDVFRLDGENLVHVLVGTVPSIAGPPDRDDGLPMVERLKFETPLTRPVDAILPRAHGKIEFEEQDDERELEIEIQDLAREAMYEFAIVSPDGMADTIFAGPSDALGDIRSKTVFFGADRLPHGVVSFGELDGFDAVVTDADGQIVLEGMITVPQGAAMDGGGAGLGPQVEFTTVGAYDSWFLRGDANADGHVDIADAVATLRGLFQGEDSTARCEDAIDTNDDGVADISDPIYTLLHLFAGGDDPPYPGTALVGADPTVDLLFCED